MGIISKPYKFSTGLVDPDRLNANLDLLYTLVNGGLDGDNIAEGAIGADNLNDSISPDVRWGETFRNYVVSDLVVTNSGLGCIVTTGIAYISGQRVIPSSSGHTVQDESTTYCDLSSDGTFSWNSNVSPLTGYLRLAKIVSTSGDCTITDMRTFNPLAVWDLESEILTGGDATTTSGTYSTLLTVTMMDVEDHDTLIMAMNGQFVGTADLYGSFNFKVGGASQPLARMADCKAGINMLFTVIDLYAVIANAATLVVNLQWKTSTSTLTAKDDTTGLYVLRLRPTR